MAAHLAFDAGYRRRSEPHCTLCRTSPELRERWGCDTPTEAPREWLECFECESWPPEAQELCPHCEGSRRLPVHRCPNAVITERHQFVCQAVAQYENGMLPYGGLGWAELPATLVDAMTLVAGVVAEIQRTKAESD